MKLKGRMGIKVSYTPKQIEAIKWGLDTIIEQRLLVLDEKDEEAAIALSSMFDTVLSKEYTSNRPIVLEVSKRQYRILGAIIKSLGSGEEAEVVEGSPLEVAEAYNPITVASVGKVSRKDIVYPSIITYRESQELLPIFDYLRDNAPFRELREGASRVGGELRLTRDIDYGELKGRQVLLGPKDAKLLDEVRSNLRKDNGPKG